MKHQDLRISDLLPNHSTLQTHPISCTVTQHERNADAEREFTCFRLTLVQHNFIEQIGIREQAGITAHAVLWDETW